MRTLTLLQSLPIRRGGRWELLHCVAKGAFVQMPQGSTHYFAVVSKTARFLTITDGRDAGRFFADLSTLGQCAPDAAHLPAIIDIAKRNHLTSPLFE